MSSVDVCRIEKVNVPTDESSGQSYNCRHVVDHNGSDGLMDEVI